MKSLLLLLMQLCCWALPEFTIDPGRITWWQDQWNKAPIIPDTDHVGASSLTFNLRLQTALTEGIVVISAPGVAETSSDVTSIDADTDYSLTLAVTPFTVAGYYGPFTVMTRSSATGNILDVNNAFGSIYLTDWPAAQTLEVTTNNATITAGVELEIVFDFTLLNDVWPHDTFEIVLPTNVQASASPQCISEDVSLENYLCDSTNATECAVACETLDSGSILIYGVTTEVEGPSKPVSLTVSGFTFPALNIDWTTFTGWQILHTRFGTNTVITDFSDTTITPSITIEGSLANCTISGVNFDLSEAVAGTTTFAQADCTFSNTIPASGKLIVTFSAVSIANGGGEANECYSTLGTCGYSTTTLTVTVSEDTSPETTLTLYFYATFNTNAAVSSVETQESSGQVIDQNSESFLIPLSTTNTQVTFSIKLAEDKTGVTTSADLNSALATYMMIEWATGQLAAEMDTLQITCPLSTSLSFKSIQISSDAEWTYSLSSDHTLVGDGGDAASFYTSPTVQNNVINLAVAKTTDFNTYLPFEGDVFLAVTSTIRAPLVRTNLLTMYECVLAGSKDATTYSGNVVLPISSDDGTKNVYSAQILCTDPIDGIPLYILVTPEIILNSDYSFLLTFSTGPSVGTTLSGASLPISPNTFEAEYSDQGIILRAGSNLSGSHVIYLPVGADAVTSGCTLYYTESGIDHVMMEYATASAARGSLTAGSGELSGFDGSETATVGREVEVSLIVETISTDYWIGVGNLPLGTSISSNFFEVLNGDRFTFDQVGSDVEVVGALLQYSSSQLTSAGLTIEFLVTFSAEIDQKYAVYVSSPSNLDSTCIMGAESDAALDISSGTITIYSISPTNSKAQGPNALDKTLSISVTLKNPVPVGGSIVIDLNDFWVLPDTCDVSGLEDEVAASSTDPGTLIDCSIDTLTNVITITQFSETDEDDRISVTVEGVYPASDTAVTRSSDGGSATSCIESIITYNGLVGGGATSQIDTANVSSATECTSSSPDDPGQSESFVHQFYPNTSGVTADLYVAFTITQEVPSGSEITITYSGTVQTNANPYCWTNFEYSDCSTTSSAVLITATEEITDSQTLEIYIDNCVTPRQQTLPETFSVQVTWNSVVLVDDSFHSVSWNATVNNSTETFTPTLSPSIITPGEYSDYVFTFAEYVEDIQLTDTLLLVFPHEFDPLVGSADKRFQASGDETYYLTCSKGESTVECSVNHWKVFITNFEVVSGESFELTVEDVLNPGSLTSAQIGFFHLDSDRIPKLHNEDVSLSLGSNTPGDLVIKSLEPSTNIFDTSADFAVTFWGQSTVSMSQETKIGLLFPDQFALAITDDDEPICGLYSIVSADTTELDTQCARLSNYVYVNMTESVTIPSQQILFYNTSDIQNPEWGYTRDFNVTAEFDYDVNEEAIDSEIFPYYSHWSEKVNLYIETGTEITHKSNSHRHSAYIGLYDGDSDNTFSVGFITDDRLTVCIGASSEIYEISTVDGMPMMIDSIKIFGNPQGGLELTMPTNNFTQGDETLSYYVTAPNSLSAGLYYVEWEVSEEESECGDLYGILPRTLVEVYSCAALQVSISSSITVHGTYSVPIKVELEASPAMNLTVQFSVQDTENYSLTKSSVTFLAGETVKYFKVHLETDNDTDTSVVYTLSGTDKDSYLTPSPSTVTVELIERIDDVEISALFSTHSVTALIESSSYGVVYWFLTCSEEDDTGVRPHVKLKTLKAMFNDDLELQTTSSTESIQADTPREYVQSLLRQHCASFTYGAEVHHGDDTYVTVDGLADGVSYMMGVYIVDAEGESPTNVEADPAYDLDPTSSTLVSHVVLLDFTNSTSVISHESEITCLLALHMHIALNLLGSPIIEEEGDSTEFEYAIIYDRFNSNHSATEYLELIDSDNLVSDLYKLLEDDESLEAITYTAYRLPVTASPDFDVNPSTESEGDNTVSFTATARTSGWWCAACVDKDEDDADVVPTGWQVYYGLSAASSLAESYGCAEIEGDVESSLTVSELSSGTSYKCYHALCDQDWFSPNCDVFITASSVRTSFAVSASAVALLLTLF